MTQVEPDKSFGIFVSNFGNTPRKLTVKQAIAAANAYQSTIVDADISHEEFLGLVNEETGKLYSMRDQDSWGASSTAW